jgi:pyruvate formate lyase activating enzyme
MKIAGWRKVSFIDYPGKNSSVIFTSGCNYRCPKCHAKHLLENKGLPDINEEEIFKYLDLRKEKINAVVICGGEPTLQHTLPHFLRKIKEKGLAVKLDTNGSDYIVLGDLLEEKLVDYVAMDVEGPPQLYPTLVGKDFLDSRDGYEKAIAVVSRFPDYEFRTTACPVIRKDGEISFMTPKEIGETAKLIYDCTGSREHKYFIQPFVPHKGEGILMDSKLERFPKTPLELMEEMKKEAIKYLPKCEIRGQ